MRPQLGILLVIALLVGGVVAMRALVESEQPAPMPEAATPAAVIAEEGTEEPSAQPGALADDTATNEVQVEVTAKHPPGTIWLDAPEVMEVGKTYEVPVMVETGDAPLLTLQIVLEWNTPKLALATSGDTGDEELYVWPASYVRHEATLVGFQRNGPPDDLCSGTRGSSTIGHVAISALSMGTAMIQEYEPRWGDWKTHRGRAVVDRPSEVQGHQLPIEFLYLSFFPTTVHIIEPRDE